MKSSGSITPSPTLRKLCVQHVPIVAHDPTQGGQLPVDHAPLEVVPRTQVLQADLVLRPFGGCQSPLPYRVNCLILPIRVPGIILLRDDVMFASLDLGSQIPMAVVPNLAEQQMFGLHDFG